jgi:hypothetical protein
MNKDNENLAYLIKAGIKEKLQEEIDFDILVKANYGGVNETKLIVNGQEYVIDSGNKTIGEIVDEVLLILNTKIK